MSDYTGKPFEKPNSDGSSTVTINGLDNKLGVAGKTYIIGGEGVSLSDNKRKSGGSGMKKQSPKIKVL